MDERSLKEIKESVEVEETEEVNTSSDEEDTFKKDTPESKTVLPVSKIRKQTSLPETSYEVQMSSMLHTSGLISPSHQQNFFLSPNASSNTLSGSMYTASDGMHTSRSGMTSFSGNNELYMTPNAASFASFQNSDLSSVDRLVYYSCHSNLRLMLENQSNEMLESECKDNAMNETKLRDLQAASKESSTGSLKSKLLKGIQKRHSQKKNDSNEHTRIKYPEKEPVQLVVKTDEKGQYHTSPKVIHGILKTSASSESDSVKHNESDGKKEGQGPC